MFVRASLQVAANDVGRSSDGILQSSSVNSLSVVTLLALHGAATGRSGSNRLRGCSALIPTHVEKLLQNAIQGGADS